MGTTDKFLLVLPNSNKSKYVHFYIFEALNSLMAPSKKEFFITDNNDETGTTDKFLLLVDQLSLEQPQHLSIKDIGIILDRLSSKIIDVAILDREIEATDTHNWTIKVGTDRRFGLTELLGQTSTVLFSSDTTFQRVVSSLISSPLENIIDVAILDREIQATDTHN